MTGINIKKEWWTLCHWACCVQFEYSWEDKQYLGTCEFLSQPPDCRSRSPSLNQLQSEWLKSDPGKKKSPNVFPLIHCQEFSLQQEEFVYKDKEARIAILKHSSRKVKMWNYAANEPKTIGRSLSPVREAGKAHEEEEPVLPARQFCLLMNMYKWKNIKNRPGVLHVCLFLPVGICLKLLRTLLSDAFRFHPDHPTSE